MPSQSPPRAPPKPSKGKGKGARRVSSLSEEQRNKKRENDRIAQQNIRRRNKELIEGLQKEVQRLTRLKSVEVNGQLQRQKEQLEYEVQALRKALLARTGRSYPAPGMSPAPLGCESRSSRTLTLAGAGFDVDGLPPAPGHTAGYGNVPDAFRSSYLPAAHPYDQWPGSVVPVPPSVTVHSVESSPGASGPSEDFTPAYVHTSVPMLDAATIVRGNGSPASLDISKGEYDELKSVSVPPTSDRYSSHGVTQELPAYTQESPWSVYSTGPYYAQAAPL